MPRNPSRPRTPLLLRRASTFVAIVFTAFACVQCRPAHNSVTGVDIGAHAGSARPSVCLHGCLARSREEHRAEQVRHRRAMRECRGNRACTIAERAAHRERKAWLTAALRDCRRGCYGEGAGSGGR